MAYYQTKSRIMEDSLNADKMRERKAVDQARANSDTRLLSHDYIKTLNLEETKAELGKTIGILGDPVIRANRNNLTVWRNHLLKSGAS